MKSLRTAFLGELVGTFILTFFGCGVVAASVTTGAMEALVTAFATRDAR